LVATTGGVRVADFDKALGAIADDQHTGLVRTGIDDSWQPVSSHAEFIDTAPSDWQTDKTDPGGLTFDYEDGLAGGRVESRWLTIGGSGAIRFVTRGDTTFLYTGGSQTFSALGITISYGARPEAAPALSRREIIAGGGSAGQISIADNPQANGGKPAYELPGLQAVTDNERFIAASARKHGVDADLMRAIVWVESTHGYYDAILSPFDLNKSILPMNINTQYWGNTWGTRDDLRNPSLNIDAGARILKSISTAMPRASVAARATIYNNVNATRVSDYGMRVQEVYTQKPWVNWEYEPKTPWYIMPRH
jgi:hypothetical protein